MAYTVGEMAKLARVSVRTLHHYDAVGLLRPTARSQGGYRLYGREDLERLQQILFFRELGFGLAEIQRIVLAPSFDRVKALREQRTLLAERAARAQAMVAAIEKVLAEAEGGARVKDNEMFEVFGEFDPSKYEDEVRQRWGDTDAYKESARRAARYTKKDWEEIKREGEEITGGLARLMKEGRAPSDPQVLDLVEKARLQIDRRFYPCSREMHVALGEMYIADPRFTETYERIAPGLAQFVHDAILANAEREA